MTTLSILPRRADSRIDWKAFFSAAKVGDTFVLTNVLVRSIASSARMHAVSTRQADNGDGTFTLTIIEASQREREQILAEFARLNFSQLKALHTAAQKSGLFA